VPICNGDGILTIGGEQCDDGNLVSGDGCTDLCSIELGYECPTPGVLCNPICGDGWVVTGKEDCDDGS